MRIEKTAPDAQNRCVYSLYKEKGCIGHAVTCADCFEALEIAPEWQSRGYGSYLLREVLRQNGGFDRTAPANSPRHCRMPAIPLRRRWRQSSVLCRAAGCWCAAACRT